MNPEQSAFYITGKYFGIICFRIVGISGILETNKKAFEWENY